MNPHGRPSIRRDAALATGLSALLCAATLPWLPPGTLGSVALAWALNAGLSFGVLILIPRALGPDTTRFLIFGLGAQIVRLVILIALFALALASEKSSRLGFVSAGLVGYFVHLFAEIAWLAHRAAAAPAKT